MPNCLNTQQPNPPAHLAIYFQLIQKYGIYLPMSRWEIVTVMSKKESPCDLSITGAYLFMEATPGFELARMCKMLFHAVQEIQHFQWFAGFTVKCCKAL